MGAVVAFHLEFEKLTCGECGIIFAVPPHWLNARREENENGGSFYCPNGHARQFRETECDRLKRLLETEQKRHEWEKARAERLSKSLIATEGHLTRLKRRVAQGVCPACQRSFENLRRHIKTKHPQLALPVP